MPASTTLLPSQRLCGIVHEILRLLSSASQAALAGAIDTTNAVELYKKLFVLLSSTAENLADATTPLVAGVTETHAHHEQTNSTSPQPSSGHNDRLAARGQLIDQVDKMIAWTRKVCQEDASTANTSAFKSVVVELSASTKRVFVLENARLEKAYVCTNCGLALDAECVACDRPHSGTHAWFHRACVSLAPGQFECMPWTCSNECGNSQEDIAGQDLYPDESVSNVVSRAIASPTCPSCTLGCKKLCQSQII
ncbi:hypothetical protein CAOG_00096 [Capsaspora owczarzaki ATCC 30864]|uniref:hypothetical protein n=1 Tax=Capsaspora owczarzaki (strain ATCC 30864) TaxID=595528 RepID=UPI0001FE49A0|nr:hypothetical protein CAOG_00096 [Capsaspora owczarzaki ATCC 30864]|eukprot:XP_004364967.1 hypothetical protein CAOG_00096 [Capsaspora owczarzaki ATCC 30864]